MYRSIVSRGKLALFARRAAFEALNFKYRTIKLHVNDSCNLKCKNCYRDPPSNNYLTKSDICGIIDQLKPVGNNFNLHILGGEPLLREDIYEIIAYANRKIRDIIVFTNATMINPEEAVKIRRSGVSAVIATLHSCDRATHDNITQSEGSWTKTVEGIKNLVAAGLPTYTFTVLMGSNKGSLSKIECFVRSLGAKTLYFPYIRQQLEDELCIADQKDFQDSICWVFNKSGEHRKKLLSILSKRPKICSAFVSTINIKADGTLTPCPFLNLNLGNIREDGLYSLLRKTYNNGQLLDFLSIPGECKECSLVKVCGGGCKAYRFNLHNDALSKDANCNGPYKDKIPVEDLGNYMPYVF